MNKNIIIGILVVIMIAIGGALVLGHNGKTNTQINIINNETFQQGEHVDIELKDAQGHALAGKTVEITFNNQKFSVTTDQYGKCYVTVNGMSSGKYDLEVKYAGDDTYNGCDAKATITVDTSSTADNIAEPTTSNATANSAQTKNTESGLTYYPDLGAYVNSKGIIVSQDGEGTGIGMTVAQYRAFLERANSGFDPEDPHAYDQT